MADRLRELGFASALAIALGVSSCRTPPMSLNDANARAAAANAAAAALERLSVEHVTPPIEVAGDREARIVEGRLVERAIADEIVVAGRHFHIGAPVVLWSDPSGYDAYRETGVFGEASVPDGKRYRPGRAKSGGDDGREPNASGAKPSLDETRELVDQFVIHYDVCGLSRTCFKVLQDRRGLSVHFMLDLDGTIYQTLDLADTAWHAKQANPRSIGIEIANLGAYPPDAASPLDAWYERDDRGTVRIRIPRDVAESGLRDRELVLRPARAERVRGTIQGEELEMYDLTPEQYDSLVKLAVALTSIFPKIRAEVPRDADGSVRSSVLSDVEFAAYSGILGHFHISKEKQDPGPAFDWERFLARVRALRSLSVNG